MPVDDLDEDTLAAADEICRSLIRQYREVERDETQKPAKRRAEMRTIARHVRGLLPAARLFAAEKAVRAAADTQETVVRGGTTTPVEQKPAESDPPASEETRGADQPTRPLRIRTPR